MRKIPASATHFAIACDGVTGVAGLVAAERKDRLRSWARDIKRWEQLADEARARAAASPPACATARSLAEREAGRRAGAAEAARRSRAGEPSARGLAERSARRCSACPASGRRSAQRLAERGLATVEDCCGSCRAATTTSAALRAARRARRSGRRRSRSRRRSKTARDGLRARAAHGPRSRFADDDGAASCGGALVQRVRRHRASGCRRCALRCPGVVRGRKGAREMIATRDIARVARRRRGSRRRRESSCAIPRSGRAPGAPRAAVPRVRARRRRGADDGVPAAVERAPGLGSRPTRSRALHLPPPRSARRGARGAQRGDSRRGSAGSRSASCSALGVARRAATARREAGAGACRARERAEAGAGALRRSALPFAPTGRAAPRDRARSATTSRAPLR